ncbi:MAG: DUF3102 domain-containing protein, partial [Gemmataceae bacterium]|nr:DUF3102 domain-containing protein [Gemmataceae bacterium]
KLELRVLELAGTLNLRPTLDRAAELGGVLSEAKAMLSHGKWLPWLRQLRIGERSARNYMTVFREVGNRQLPADMTIEQFLMFLRNSRINGKKREREQVRQEVADRLGTLPDSITLNRADCRRFDWPAVDAIVTDPPWADMSLYRWLGSMAVSKLKPGGMLLLQCGTGFMPEVLSIIAGAGLTYRWCLSFGYAETRRAKPTSGRWLSAWNPVLVFSRGELKLADALGDFYLVHYSRDTKDLHDWQQPVKPFAYWMKVLFTPGSLVADPFAGSGTTGVAAREVALRWVGTEIDPKVYKVARGRLLGQGQHKSKGSTKAKS